MSELPLKSTQISRDSQDLEAYGRDWTRLHIPSPSVVVFPESTADVVKLVEWARGQKKGLVPSGGRTGLSAGAYATNGEVVVSFDRMRTIYGIEPIDQVIHCDAGVPTEELQNFAEGKGFFFPIDLASRGSSQIGGNVSTNAGGTKVIRYGHTRDWVAGLKVVTGTGQILCLDRCLVKDNSGYDLKQLFIAAEGTLGFITETWLRVTEKPRDLSVILLATDSLKKVLKILKIFRQQFSLTGFEFFTDVALRYVLKQQGLQKPFEKDFPIYALVEFECPSDNERERALEAFEECERQSLILDGAMSQSPQQAEEFWAYRERISESLSSFKPYKSDISVLVSQMPAFVEDCERLLGEKFSNLEFVWFGHIGDGNLHINILPRGSTEAEFRAQIEPISHALFSLLQKYRGSLSAEHGIGLIKKPYFHYTTSKEEIEFMRSIKKIFDPDGIMNPGKIFD